MTEPTDTDAPAAARCAAAASARLRAGIERAKDAHEEFADVVRAHPTASIAIAAAVGAALAYVLARRR